MIIHSSAIFLLTPLDATRSQETLICHLSKDRTSAGPKHSSVDCSRLTVGHRPLNRRNTNLNSVAHFEMKIFPRSRKCLQFLEHLSLSPTGFIKSQYSSIHTIFLYSFELDILQHHRKVTALQFSSKNNKDRRSACPYSLTVILNHHSNQRV